MVNKEISDLGLQPLKVADLRIGNYVRASVYGGKGEPEWAHFTGKINAILSLTDIEVGDRIRWTVDGVSGIQLNESWLTRLGFIDNIPWEYKHLRLDDQERLHIVDQAGYGIIISRGVQYVHQIQNIYFALTGEELEVKS